MGRILRAMKMIVIFFGPPAGGKTTLAHALEEALPNSRVIEVDEIKMDVSNKMKETNGAELREWLVAINRELASKLRIYETVILDEGFFSREQINQIVRGLEDVPLFLIQLKYPLEDHLKNDARSGGAEREALTETYRRFEQVPPAERIPADFEIAVNYGPAKNLRLVLEALRTKTRGL